jgi:hypothetical protein
MKVDGKAKVEKALAPEEKQLIGNIRSILDQLEQEEQAEPEEGAEGGEPEGGEDGGLFAAAMKAAGELGADGTPEGPGAVKKGVFGSGSGDRGAVANDTADQRTGEEPDEGEKALALIGKALGLVKPKQEVRKSATLQALEGITQVVGRLAVQVDQQNQAFANLVDGMGLSEVAKSQEAESVRQVRQAPSMQGGQQSAAMEMLAAAILKAAGSDGAAAPGKDMSLGELMQAIVPRG